MYVISVQIYTPFAINFLLKYDYAYYCLIPLNVHFVEVSDLMYSKLNHAL